MSNNTREQTVALERIAETMDPAAVEAFVAKYKERERIKRWLLDEYAGRPAIELEQYDGFVGDRCGDRTEHSVTWGLTRGAPVCVLIKSGGDRNDVLRLLKQLTDLVGETYPQVNRAAVPFDPDNPDDSDLMPF